MKTQDKTLYVIGGFVIPIIAIILTIPSVFDQQFSLNKGDSAHG